MRIKDFEKAADALGAELQYVRLGSHTGGQVHYCVGKIGENTIKWDWSGRAFIVESPIEEIDREIGDDSCKRDEKFDLKFD